MSDLPATAIVEEMQKLDDIEADLADTALAVVQESELDTNVSETHTSDPNPTGTEALLQNAEAVEHVLEESIPPAPSIIPTPAADPAVQPTPIDSSTSTSNVPEPIPAAAPSRGYDPSEPQSDDYYQPPQQSQVADEALEILHAVEEDVDVPILPTEAEAALKGPSADATAPTVESADTNGHAMDAAGPSSTPMQQENGFSSVIQPESAQEPTVPGQLVPNPPNAGVPLGSNVEPAPVEDIKPDIDLPEGLSLTSSPSIIANPDLFRAWARDPKDPNLVLGLFSWAAQKSEVADARAWYALLAEDEPTAVQPLLTLINLELALTNFSQVEALFAKALKGPSGGITAAADVSIWKAYLHYIRRQNPITEENAEAVRATITKAYEFALNECGTDRESGEVWQEYIAFVAEPTPKNSWDTQAQTDTLRKIYQRAVCIPLNNVEALWKAYDAFESNQNKATAKKFLADKSPAYMTARTALRELRTLTDSLPRPPLPPRPTFSETDRAMVSAWKNYLKWEEGNPLVIEDEELRAQRIGYALRKCLGEMRHFPELWHYAINYYISSGKASQAAEAAQAGVQACPTSMLLTFALADIEEDRKNLAQCHETYEALINRLNPQIDELEKQVAIEVENAKGPEIVRPQGTDVDMAGDADDEVQRLIEERENRGKLVAQRRGKDVSDLAAAVGIVWVMYMRFARRAEGTISARNVFKKARQTSHPTWQIYEASAMTEYHANKDVKVAIRIFELGLKLFSDEVDYVVRYLQFLLSVNDDTTLFERSAAKIPAEKSRPLWDAWARYEYMYGDLSGVQKLEARFAEVFTNDSPLKRFAQRFVYNGLDQIALRDLGFGIRHPAPAPQPSPVQPLTSQAPIPLPAQTAQFQQLPTPPQAKRPLPDDPRLNRPPSPTYKRPRAQSPQGRRFTPPHTDRIPSGSNMPPRGFRDQASRDRSPPPPTYNRPPVPPASVPAGYASQGYSQQGSYPTPPPPQPSYGGYSTDRSGLPRPLVQFIGSLPSARSFDGPSFRVHEIIDLFDHVSRDGTGVRGPPGGPGGYAPPGPPGQSGPHGPQGGYAPPPQRAGYGDPRGYGQPPRGRY